MKIRLLLSCAVVLLGILSSRAGAEDREPGCAMILSTGDNLFYYKWFPIDSPAGMASSFDIFKRDYNVDRIIWRGAQAQWMANDNVFRPESEEIADLYRLEMELETRDKLSRHGETEARKKGLAYWGYMPFFEVGQSQDAVSMSGFGPYNFEEKIRAEHPEFRLHDRAGVMSGSTIEFGYPEVRKAYLDRYEKMFSPGGEFSIYDGIIFYTYVENFFPRYSDQFIYSDLAVKTFKERYGVDVLTQPFDMDKFLAMRGEFVTQYLREMRALFNKHGKKLAFYIDAREPEIPQRWPSYPGILVPGRVKMDWRTWVKEGLVDEIALRSANTIADIQPFLDATRGTKIRLSLLTNQMPPELKPLHSQGVTRHIWSPELPTDFPKHNAPVTALDGNDLTAILSVLRQARDNEINVPDERLIALLDHPDLMVRRQAVAAILGRRLTAAIPALEKAAMDPENSLRCPVIDALGTLHGEKTVAVIADALAKYPQAGMRIVARTAWSMMMPDRADDLIKVYQSTSSAYVRQAILETMVAKHAVPPIEAIPSLRPLVNAGAKDADENVRAMAAFALGFYPDDESAKSLLAMMDDQSIAVQNDAIFSLGELARRINNFDLRETIYQQLVNRLDVYGSKDNGRNDNEWGYRIVAESLMFGFGPRGERHLADLLNGSNEILADRAWRVLFHPNDGWNFYELSAEQGEANYAYYPRPLRTNLPRKQYALPADTILLNQDFSKLSPDPTGVIGSVWSAAGKWTGADAEVRFTEDSGISFAELGVSKSGIGARMIGSRAFDLPDGRFKNRLRGHFPSSPVAFGLADGVVTLSLEVRKLDDQDSLKVMLASDTQSKTGVGFLISSSGGVQPIGHGDQPTALNATSVKKGEWSQIALSLNFVTGKAAIDAKGAERIEFAFDRNQQYRVVVLQAAGAASSRSQVANLRLSQRIGQ
jgi:hypothetical protein